MGHPCLWANEKYLDYALTGHDTTTENAQIYRAVIQAGGDLNASFRNNISNTSLTPNAGGIGGTLSAPALNTLSSQDISGSVKKTGPGWYGPVRFTSLAKSVTECPPAKLAAAQQVASLTR